MSDQMPRRVTILGSTGSVGCCTVELIRENPGRFEVVALTARDNMALLARQAKELGAKMAVTANPMRYEELNDLLSGTGIEVAAGPAALIDAAARPEADLVMAAIVGAAGLPPVLAAARRGAVIALANKEVLVCAGTLVRSVVQENGGKLLPVDSEHNAIFQIFDFERPDQVEKIILTASGGPFRKFELAQMKRVTPAQAIAHPNWDMGAKISVDSATMMNKGLELIEAVHLFPMESNRIEVLVHPQSVIHSMVAYHDGSVLAQMGTPDMRIPISYTLAWPDRLPSPTTRLDFAAVGQLTFENPDSNRFPALRLAREALSRNDGGTTILNAANEVAVDRFLGADIGFLDIAGVVEDTLSSVNSSGVQSLDEIIELDLESRDKAEEFVRARRATHVLQAN